MTEPEYEYGIWFDRGATEFDKLHRVGYDRTQALIWIADWLEMGGRPGAFEIVRRPRYAWEKYEDYTADELKDAARMDMF